MNINDTILKMTKENRSLNEICDVTGLSSKQLFYRLYLLKAKGYDFSRKYYYDGNIVYNLNNDVNINNKNNIIYTNKGNNEFKAIIISDLHLSNNKDRIDLLNKVYDFAINNNYNIIINAGDVIDGLLGFTLKKYNDIIKQIEYALKVYPYDKNILNFICFGNHDYDAFVNTGSSIENVVNVKRHDLVSLGYGMGEIFVKNDSIKVVHPKCNSLPIDINNGGLIIEGHSHSVGYKENGYGRIIYVNALSDVIDKYPAGFMTINSNFNNGILSNTIVESYLFINNSFIKTSEYACNLSLGKDTSNKDIKYEEKAKKKELKINRTMSQVEKFNIKYNR